MTPEQEKFLLFRIRHFQDEFAFKTLFTEYAPRIERYLRLRLPNRTEADDACSETWMNLWNYAQSAEIQSFIAVALTIARNAVANFYKTKEKRAEVLVDDSIMETHASGLHQSVITKVDSGLIKDVISELSEESSQIMLLRYVECFSIKEIAKQIGKTENATSVIIHRSIKKVREIIEHRFGQL